MGRPKHSTLSLLRFVQTGDKEIAFPQRVQGRTLAIASSGIETSGN